jgi:hypothetical protein
MIMYDIHVRIWNEAVVAYLKGLSQYAPDNTDDNYKGPLSDYPVAQLRFEVHTSYIQVYKVTAILTCSVQYKELDTSIKYKFKQH